MAIKTSLSPNKIFEALLLEHKKRGRETLTSSRRKLHRAFYDVQREFSEEMREFEFLLRTHPYSPTLDIIIRDYRQAKIIAIPDEPGEIMIRNLDSLQNPSEEATHIAKIIYSEMYN